MEILIILLVFLFVVVFVMAIGTLIMGGRGQVKDRLTGIKKMSAEMDPEVLMRIPFHQRIIIPALNNFGYFLGRIAPQEIRTRMDRKITHAGRPWNLNFFSLLALQILLGAGFFMTGLFFIRLMQATGGLTFLVLMVLTVVGFFIPYSMVNMKAEARQMAIQRSLPDVLDLLLVSVEAGLGFDMAMKRVTQQMVGPLSEEIKRALDEIRMGGTREVALRSIATRSGVKDLSSFISSVIQSEELGSNIAGTLRVQSDYMRQRRRQRAEEMATKAPVKLVFPLLFFIFPALFVVILGPAAINIFRMFAGL